LIKLSKIFFITFFIFGAIIFCFVDRALCRVVITGDRMEIKNKGEVTIFKGNSKISSDLNTITASNVIYNKSKYVVSAYGDVRFLSNLKDNKKTIEGYGNFARYDMNGKKGKIWGDAILKLKHFANNSNLTTITICAREVYIDDNLKTLKACNDVEVVTSYGKVYSDNAVFSQKEDLYTVFEKDKKRPVANIFHDGGKGVYKADKMVFCDSKEKKRIIMSGLVEVKIEMEDKKSDT
jgi:lipopolysaccharide export system protein LptA